MPYRVIGSLLAAKKNRIFQFLTVIAQIYESACRLNSLNEMVKVDTAKTQNLWPFNLVINSTIYISIIPEN